MSARTHADDVRDGLRRAGRALRDADDSHWMAMVDAQTWAVLAVEAGIPLEEIAELVELHKQDVTALISKGMPGDRTVTEERPR